jgi:hypothetical protein
MKKAITKKPKTVKKAVILTSGLSELEKLNIRVVNLEKAFNEILKTAGARLITPDETSKEQTGVIRYGN